MARDYFGRNVNPYTELYGKNRGPKPEGPRWVKILVDIICVGLMIGACIWLLYQ